MNSRHGSELLVAIAFLLWLAGGSVLRAEERPTSLDCTKDRTPLALMVCSNQKASAAERQTATAYLARYFSLDEKGRASFRNDHLHWANNLVARCTPSQNPLQKMLGTPTAPSRECVTRSYTLRTELYRSKLHASALEETHLSLGELRTLQSRLVELKFLSAKVDGMFGAETRLAIRNYQASIAHPQTSFLTGDERNMLLAASTAIQTLTQATASAPTSLSTPTPMSASEPSPKVPLPQPSNGESGQNRSSNIEEPMPAGGQIVRSLVQNVNPSPEPEVTKQADGLTDKSADQPSYLTRAVAVLLISIFACIGSVLIGGFLLMRLHHGRERGIEENASTLAPQPPNQSSASSRVVAPVLVSSVD